MQSISNAILKYFNMSFWVVSWEIFKPIKRNWSSSFQSLKGIIVTTPADKSIIRLAFMSMALAQWPLSSLFLYLDLDLWKWKLTNVQNINKLKLKGCISSTIAFFKMIEIIASLFTHWYTLIFKLQQCNDIYLCKYRR